MNICLLRLGNGLAFGLSAPDGWLLGLCLIRFGLTGCCVGTARHRFVLRSIWYGERGWLERRCRGLVEGFLIFVADAGLLNSWRMQGSVRREGWFVVWMCSRDLAWAWAWAWAGRLDGSTRL